VDVVEDGQRALAAAISGSYALVLMDCQMPVLDGFRATKAIRRLEGAIGQVPIVAMTAQAMRGDREKCIQAGMSDYLPKPVKSGRTESALERWCGQRTRRRPQTKGTSGRRFNKAVSAARPQLIYLVPFSYAFFFKGFQRALAVTIGCIVTLFVAMQMTGRIRWAEKFGGKG